MSSLRQSAGAVLGLLIALAPPLRAAEPVRPAGGEQAADAAAERLGLQVSRDAPMTISADTLEAYREEDGRERIVFEGSVEVVQGDLEIDCDWLEALYPRKNEQGESGPVQISARGNVQIRQTGVRVTCTNAVLDRHRDRAVCTSGGEPAVLRRGEDAVQGSTIIFDLRNGKVTVRGGARVVVQPKPRSGNSTPPQAEPLAAPGGGGSEEGRP